MIFTSEPIFSRGTMPCLTVSTSDAGEYLFARATVPRAPAVTGAAGKDEATDVESSAA